MKTQEENNEEKNKDNILNTSTENTAENTETPRQDEGSGATKNQDFKIKNEKSGKTAHERFSDEGNPNPNPKPKADKQYEAGKETYPGLKEKDAKKPDLGKENQYDDEYAFADENPDFDLEEEERRKREDETKDRREDDGRQY